MPQPTRDQPTRDQPTRGQGTVSEFDPTARTGAVLLDDGTAVPFPAEAFAVSGLRLLRPGQRVRIDRDAHGEVTRVTLFTLV